LFNDTDSLDWTTNNDILQYVVGIDRPHFIRFLNPDDSFFTSFQVFETYYPGAPLAPMAARTDWSPA